MTQSPDRPARHGLGIVQRFRGAWLGPGKPYWGLLFVLPIFVFFVLFKFWPAVQAIRLSLFEANPVSTKETFVALGNYVALTKDPLFFKALGVTASYVIATVGPLMILSLFLAVLLNQGLRGTAVLRALIFLPAIVPIIVVPVLWRNLFHPYGLVNDGLALFGVAGPNWLLDKNAVVPALIIPSEWRFVPLYMVIYLAGLQSIPGDLYDAATVDGASRLQRFRWITLPLLKPTTLVVLIAAVTFTSKTLVLPLVLTEGGPDNASTPLSLFVFLQGFVNYKLGYASAASMVLLLIIVVFTVVNLRLFRTDE